MLETFSLWSGFPKEIPFSLQHEQVKEWQNILNFNLCKKQSAFMVLRVDFNKKLPDLIPSIFTPKIPSIKLARN
jgi:hypothetical protein